MAAKYSDKEYIRAARNEYEREGEIEIDSNAVVSRGDDPGAYVQAWVWVSHEDVRAHQSKTKEVTRCERTRC